MSRLIGLLSWYREDPAFLERAIRSYHELGITHLVALDGPYALFPHGGTVRSSDAEYDTIARVCQELELGGLIDTGREWAGNEIEKRTALFRLGEQFVTDPAMDRYAIVDADEHAVTTWTPEAFRARLDELPDHPTITLKIRTIHDPGGPSSVDMSFELPKIFRATPGLHCADNHYTYRTPDGQLYWHQANPARQTPHALIPGVEIHHYTRHRTTHRHDQAGSYYRARDNARAEQLHVPTA